MDQVGAGPTEYIRASGMVLARVAGSAVTWLHPDHLGSAVAGTGPTGAVAWRESEQPFGEDWISAPANDNLAGYTGHVEDAATGLVYMQARYYDPVIGRFLANDPVGFSPGRPDMFNRYAYAANDPVNMVDPDGEFGVPGAIIGALIGGGIEAGAQIAKNGKITDLKSIGAQAAVGAATGALGGAGAGLLKAAGTGIARAGIPGLNTAATLAKKYGSDKLANGLSKLDKATSLTGKLDTPGRVAAGTLGLTDVATAGAIKEINDSQRAGESPEVIEGAIEGVSNAIVPGSGAAIDAATDAMKEQRPEQDEYY